MAKPGPKPGPDPRWTEYLTVRVTPAVREGMDELVAQRNTSLSTEMRRALRAHLEKAGIEVDDDGPQGRLEESAA